MPGITPSSFTVDNEFFFLQSVRASSDLSDVNVDSDRWFIDASDNLKDAKEESELRNEPTRIYK